MSTTITIRQAETVALDNIEILAVRDLFAEKKIIARIKGLPQGIVLWNGDAEYTAASNWTNDSALARATEILTSGTVTFA
jgi:hypothetical protein